MYRALITALACHWNPDLFLPEIAKALGVEGSVKAGKAVMISYIGLISGRSPERYHQSTTQVA